MFKILILFSLISVSFCYLYIIPSEIAKSKDHDGYCYHPEKKLLIKTGDKILKDCEEIRCNDDYSIRVAGCGTFSLYDPKCKRFERDFSHPYPQCCTSFICVEPVDELINDIDQIERNSLE